MSVSLTILIPVYNTEKYLPECLDSIFSQTFQDFEVIAVNDGSTDDTLKILKRYAKTDSRLKIISKKNSGYGDSLNRALKRARGDYIGIVEPDDFIAPKMYETLISLAKKHNADLVKGSFYYYYGKTEKSTPEKLFLHGETGHVLNPRKEQNIFLTSPTIWSAIYRRATLEKHHVEFLPTPGASYQDIGFAFKTFATASRVYCTNRPFYYYRQDNSASSVKSSGKVLAVKTEYDAVDDFLKTNHLSKTFGEVAAACRFRSYMWNLNRLPYKTALSFAKTARKDYENAVKNTTFTADYYTGLERASETKLATAHPTLYVYLRPLYSLKNHLLRMLAAAYHRIVRKSA